VNQYPSFQNIIFTGGELPWTVVVLLGLSTLVANALSMGIGEYLSSKAHREFVLAEKRRALWEFKHYRNNEVDQVRCPDPPAFL
jgi:DNA damage-binding protein 1